MIQIKKWQSKSSARTFSVRCDSKGRTGYWSCENLSPVANHRDEAASLAKAAGWIATRTKWYCPECQRDGFVPKSAAPSNHRQAQQFVE
jgi:hypothetical protein